MSPQKIDHWDVIIQGFTQRAKTMNGMARLWRKLHLAYAGGNRVVSIRPWNHDWKELALTISRLADRPVDVRIYAYSWGAGNGFVNLARHLWNEGLEVQYAVLSDPVYYAWWFPVFAFSPFRKIAIPPNVHHVEYFIQRQNHPRGAILKATGKTFVAGPYLLEYYHAGMDNCPEFEEKSFEIAGVD